MRGGEDVDAGAARDQRRGLVGRDPVFEQAEAARRPRAFQIQIGAVREQHVEQRQVLLRHRHRPAVEVADRRVHRCADLGVLDEQGANPLDLAGAQRNQELVDRRRVSDSILRFIAAQLSKP